MLGLGGCYAGYLAWDELLTSPHFNQWFELNLLFHVKDERGWGKFSKGFYAGDSVFWQKVLRKFHVCVEGTFFISAYSSQKRGVIPHLLAWWVGMVYAYLQTEDLSHSKGKGKGVRTIPFLCLVIYGYCTCQVKLEWCCAEIRDLQPEVRTKGFRFFMKSLLHSFKSYFSATNLAKKLQ